jgi:gas vesicle protein
MTDYEHSGDFQAREGGRMGTAFLFLFIGLGLGAVAALLAAPESGQKTRKMLRRRFHDAREAIEGFGERAEDMVERGSGWARAAEKKVKPFTKRFRRA